jgi:2-methylcitrate dehydratase PrpD
MEDFTVAATMNKEMLDLTGKMRAEIDPALNNSRGIEPARVKIVLNDGTVFSEQVELALGTPSRPMSFENCVQKFEDCASSSGYTMAEANVKKAIDLIVNLEKVRDVSELIGLFT